MNYKGISNAEMKSTQSWRVHRTFYPLTAACNSLTKKKKKEKKNILNV